jgi:putative flippase GtrA
VLLSLLLNLLMQKSRLAGLLSYIAMIPIVYAAQRHLMFRSASQVSDSAPKYVVTPKCSGCSSRHPCLMRWAYWACRPYLIFLMVALGVAMFNFVLLRFWTFKNVGECAHEQWKPQRPI